MSLRNSTRRSGNNASSSQVVAIESTEVDTTEEEKISLVELLRAVRALEKDNAALRTENQLFRHQIGARQWCCSSSHFDSACNI